MVKIFKPYEPCPCDSGKKYKFCCFKKSKNNRSNHSSLGQLMFDMRNKYRKSNFKKCFSFDDQCNYGFIDAHSLQNNGVLKEISEDNHVYELATNQNKGLEFKKIGKNQASTFNGFCKYHDEIYFTKIEDEKYKNTSEQNFWYAYRAWALETHRLYRLKKFYSYVCRDNPQLTQNPLFYYKYQELELTIKDSNIEFEKFKKVYDNNQFDSLETFSKELNFKVGFTATTAVGVDIDPRGHPAADIYNYDEQLVIPSLFISVLPQKETTLLIVSRFKEDSCYDNIIDSLKTVSTDTVFDYITYCLSQFSENIYFSPKTIDNLEEKQRRLLLKAFVGTASFTIQDRIETTIAAQNIRLFNLKM
ncbi:SEC-C domain-containing protein [Holzapfeliella floricola]|nr:SEC-C domain-containing protein [Holzapfeliella floricola]